MKQELYFAAVVLVFAVTFIIGYVALGISVKFPVPFIVLLLIGGLSCFGLSFLADRAMQGDTKGLKRDRLLLARLYLLFAFMLAVAVSPSKNVFAVNGIGILAIFGIPWFYRFSYDL